jgi:branched-chain amino acid transport system ATP-binding protein
MLEVANLEVGYQAAVLRGVGLRVEAGAIATVLGPNGAGKTTLMRAISGLLPLHGGAIRAGEIRVDGRSLRGMRPDAIARAGVSQVMEGRRILADLTVEENLRAGGFGNPEVVGALDDAYRRFPLLGDRRTRQAGVLSGGEQQMLAIARALMSGPELLLLDEPSLGLAPKMVGRVTELIREIKDDGIAVLLVEQNARMALDLADYGYIIEGGRVMVEGSAGELRDDPTVRDIYLGIGPDARHVPGGVGKAHSWPS